MINTVKVSKLEVDTYKNAPVSHAHTSWTALKMILIGCLLLQHVNMNLPANAPDQTHHQLHPDQSEQSELSGPLKRRNLFSLSVHSDAATSDNTSVLMCFLQINNKFSANKK